MEINLSFISCKFLISNLLSKWFYIFYHFKILIWSMWSISVNMDLVHSLFIIFYECSQPNRFFCTQLWIQHMAHWGQIQLVYSRLLLSFTEYLYDMKGRVITSMEKCNIYVQCLNKNIAHLIVTHGLFSNRFPVYLLGNKLFK